MGSHVSYPSRHGDWWAPEGCFFNETACRFPCRFHLIEPKFAWGVFSCRARSRPNQTNLSMMGVVCTLITHRPTIIGDPGLKKSYFRCRIDLSIGVHIGPRRILFCFGK